MRYQTAADIGADLKRLRRDSGSKQSVVSSGVIANPEAATVVLSSSQVGVGGPPGTGTPRPRSQHPPSDPSAVIRAAAKTPWFWGAGVGVLAIAAVAATIGAVLARRGDSSNTQTQTTATPPAPAPVTPTVTSPAAPAATTATDSKAPAADQTATAPPVTTAAPSQPAVKNPQLAAGPTGVKPADETALSGSRPTWQSGGAYACLA